LLAFDASLKAERVNPGTTADFVVASLFTDTIIRRGRHTAAA
jgi:triphosphoribosyl-dephospho-CoA synthase